MSSWVFLCVGGKEAFRKEKRSKWKSKSRSVCPSGVTCLKHFLSPWGRESGFGFYFLSFLFFRGQKEEREIGMTCTEKNAQGGATKTFFFKKNSVSIFQPISYFNDYMDYRCLQKNFHKKNGHFFTLLKRFSGSTGSTTVPSPGK